MASLYELSKEMGRIVELLENEEFDPETGEVTPNEKLREEFEQIELGIYEKLDNTYYYIEELKGKAETLDKEIKRLRNKREAILNKAERLKEIIKDYINTTEDKRVKTDKFSFFIRKSKAVEIADIDKIPVRFLRIKKEADKNKIRTALLDGETVEGCYITEKQTLGAR